MITITPPMRPPFIEVTYRGKKVSDKFVLEVSIFSSVSTLFWLDFRIVLVLFGFRLITITLFSK